MSPPALPSSLPEWLARLEGRHPRAIDLGLERIAPVARRLLPAAALQRPQGASTTPVVVVVGGTNGKGGCVRLLEAILRAAGWRTGAYLSPHLLRYNERVRIDGVEASDAALCAAFARVEEACAGESLTYFEYGTLAAVDLFYRARVDALLLEVGLGGRLDAVNLFASDAALVTTVGIDHAEWLGDDREAIGHEKAGIFRPGRPAIYGGEEAPRSLLRHARRIGAQLTRAGRDFGHRIEGEGAWSWWSGAERLEALPPLTSRMHCANAAAVLETLHRLRARLPVGRAAIEQGLRAPRPVGRLQSVPVETPHGVIPTLLDVAHNPQAAAALAQYLRDTAGDGAAIAVVAMLGDKDVEGTLRAVAPQIDRWIGAELETPRALEHGRLNALLQRVAGAGAVRENVAAALRCAYAQARAGDRAVVFGSFHTVAAALRFLHIPP